MAGVIICTGEYSKVPFVCRENGIKIYSLEELCYYLYNNADEITKYFFTDELLEFIRDRLKLQELEIVLRRNISENAPMKSFIAAVLSCSEYYNSEEIGVLCKKLEKAEKLTEAQKFKRHADYMLKCGMYGEAKTEYLAAITENGGLAMEEQEYGEILHNLAVLDVMAGDMAGAAVKFKEAFEKNKNIESLKQYLYAVKQSETASVYETEPGYYLEYNGLYEQIEEGIKKAYEDFEKSPEKSEIERITELRNVKRNANAEQLFTAVVNEIKEEYKKKCV